MKKNDKKINKIKFNNLSITNFYKKLFFITQKKINEIQEKGLEPKSVQYHLEHLEEI